MRSGTHLRLIGGSNGQDRANGPPARKPTPLTADERRSIANVLRALSGRYGHRSPNLGATLKTWQSAASSELSRGGGYQSSDLARDGSITPAIIPRDSAPNAALSPELDPPEQIVRRGQDAFPLCKTNYRGEFTA